MITSLWRVFSCLLCLLALSISAIVWWEVQWMGFPDGSVTDLGRARAPVYRVFVFVSVVLSARFLYLGWWSNGRTVGKRLAISLFFYLLVLVSLVFVDHLLGLQFDHGRGG